uniref:Uncharacterized protein n=1 Tax=Setaria italica TaxID=4555 RepID=K3ZYT4_SETIT
MQHMGYCRRKRFGMHVCEGMWAQSVQCAVCRGVVHLPTRTLDKSSCSAFRSLSLSLSLLCCFSKLAAR